MRTAVDTCFVIDLVQEDPAARAALDTALDEGPLIVSGPVFAELLAAGRPAEIVMRLLHGIGARLDGGADLQLWTLAGERHARYLRNRTSGAAPKRVLADFLVGAHALLRADCLLTRDRGVYASYFPELRLQGY